MELEKRRSVYRPLHVYAELLFMGMLRYRGSGWMVQTVLGVVKVTDKSQAGIAVNVVQQQNDAVATASSFCSTVTSMKSHS